MGTMASVGSASQTHTATQHLPLSNDGSKPYPLTSSGHSGRLKYANPEDLPSYPSLGLRKDDAAASAAASLGWTNTKSISLWTTENHTTAQKAANLANDYKMSAAWKPERKPAGSKTAAVLAAENASRTGRPSSIPVSVWGNSAANQAFAGAGAGAGSRSGPRQPMTTLDRQRSLRAARGAMAGSGRLRSTSSPLTYPDSANAAANALSAATLAHRPSHKFNVDEAGSSPITKMDRQMFTANPPVKPEVDEKNHEAILHASAVAIAKSMYNHQQKMFDAAKQGRGQGQGQDGGDPRPLSEDGDSLRQPMQFHNLQEAAYGLAQERLARLHEEHQKNRDFQEYYGTSSPSSPGRKFNKLGKLRRRASSDGEVMTALAEDDRKRSRQIKKQMSLFSTRLSQVDEAQRTHDRGALLAVAQRNVKATLEGMDEKMYRQTGRVTPARLNEWEVKAHAAAQARSHARMESNASGKVDIGGGAYVDRSKVDEIAARMVQPVLDEINEKAEAERKRAVALREEQDKRKLEWEGERARNMEIKETLQKLKGEEKIRKDALKQEAKAMKEEGKAARAEEKRMAREEKYKSAEVSPEPPGTSIEETTTTHKAHHSRTFTPKLQTKHSNTKTDPSPLSSSNTSPESANDSPTTRVMNWLKSRLHRPRSKSVSVVKAGGKSDKQPGGFIGGHALTRLHADGTESMTSLTENRSASMREVALAGRLTPSVSAAGTGWGAAHRDEPGEGSHVLGGSDVSSMDSDDNIPGAARKRTGSNVMAVPRVTLDPAGLMPGVSGSPNRDSKFIEIIE